MFAFALAVFKAQAENAIKMLINRRKSDFFIKTSVGGVAGDTPAGWVGRNEVRPQGGAPPF